MDTTCPFSRIIVIVSSPGLWPPQPQAFDQFYSTRHLSSVVQGMHSHSDRKSRKCLVTPMKAVPLLYQWAHLSQSISMAAYEAHSWERDLIAFLSQHPVQHLSALWRVVSRKKACSSVPVKAVASSVMGLPISFRWTSSCSGLYCFGRQGASGATPTKHS